MNNTGWSAWRTKHERLIMIFSWEKFRSFPRNISHVFLGSIPKIFLVGNPIFPPGHRFFWVLQNNGHFGAPEKTVNGDDSQHFPPQMVLRWVQGPSVQTLMKNKKKTPTRKRPNVISRADKRGIQPASGMYTTTLRSNTSDLRGSLSKLAKITTA